MSRVDSKKRLESYFPQGTIALFFIQLFSTLSFSVLYSTLVLFMTSKLGFSLTLANSITGVFIAMNFALHLLGGYLGGRFFSNRALFCLGMIAQVLGCILLANQNKAFLYYGLAAFLTGCGLNITCINCMLTQRFQPKDSRRETAFLWNYAGMNLGFFIGFSLSGYFQLSQDYQRLFLFSSLGNMIALFLCLYFWQSLADKNSFYSQLSKDKQKKIWKRGLVIVFFLAIFLSQALHFSDWVCRLILLIGLLMVGAACWLAYQQNSMLAREKILAFAVLMVVSTVFWTLYQIGPMGLTNFIAHNVDRRLLTINIPPQWFQNINTLSIVIGGPVLSLLLNHLRGRGIKIHIPTQFACALLLIGLAFVILPWGIMRASATGMVSPGWILASFILQSAGELLISPIGYAMIGALAPQSLQGVMMGMWMLASGVGATLSSYSSNLMIAGQDSLSPLLTNSGYSRVFLELGLFSLGAALVLWLISPKLTVWIEGKKDKALSFKYSRIPAA
ncbi:Dipeptide and tripeptide permease A [Legionella massiliensis]|uniref:Dipeptide and tripeptide permease A n=1 Tax=Legionella massiliensis TaxID=1034943 RepID=A0A078KZG2_9GAMM|nr:oligopeptide:H+ symporter [Legionella massiliensis]CDZ78306.1 Dipeptide and tripeptide permease A [Legionella massiliensis]CEE14044.1 Dipeptide and tripeptide permease A [Legionella massiliensis]